MAVLSWSYSPCRLKIEELEGERRRLEEEKQQLKAQLEQLTLAVGAGEQPRAAACPGPSASPSWSLPGFAHLGSCTHKRPICRLRLN